MLRLCNTPNTLHVIGILRLVNLAVFKSVIVEPGTELAGHFWPLNYYIIDTKKEWF